MTVTFNAAETAGLKDDLAASYYAGPARQILQIMRHNSPVDTGIMRQQHGIKPLAKVRGGYLITFRVSPSWAVFVHQGHGVIVPVHAKVLRFVTKQGAVVFTKRVRAVAARPWLYQSFVEAGLDEARRTFK